MIRPPPRSNRTDTLFPYTTLFRSVLNTAPGVTKTHSLGSPRDISPLLRPELKDRREISFEGNFRSHDPLSVLTAPPAQHQRRFRAPWRARHSRSGQRGPAPSISRRTYRPQWCRQVNLDEGHYRSEERRGGQECVSPCRSRWSPTHIKQTNQQ